MKQHTLWGCLPSAHGIDLELELDTDIVFCREVCSSHQECELQLPLRSTKKKKEKDMFNNFPFLYMIHIK